MKAIGSAVALVLLLTLLVACGEDDDAGTPGGGQASGAAETDDGGQTDETDATEAETESETETQTEPEPESRAEQRRPDDGSVPELEDVGLPEAARAAGCELKSFPARSREHTSDPAAEVDYSSSPPTSGRHSATPAPDGAYFNAPDAEALVHSLEHGRVVIWFKKDLPRGARADLRAFYAQDEVQTILTPDETGSDYEVAATAWNRDPAPNGTGRLLGCERFTPEAFEALQAFKQKHRGRGPEAVP